MKQTTIHIVSTLLLCFSIVIATKAQTTGSYVPNYQQQRTQWCWAANAEMVYWAYKPGTITQCQAVNKSRDLEDSWFGWFQCGQLPSSTTSACTNGAMYNFPQAMYGCNGSLQHILEDYGIPSTSFGNQLSAADLTTAMSNKRICIARWGWNGNNGGHFVVINRYKNGNVYFNDPANGSANIWSYNTFRTANGNGTWTHTLRMNNSAVYGGTYTRPAAEHTPTKQTPVELSINMYPNPTTDKVNILLNGVREKDYTIIVTDIVGHVVAREIISKDANHITIPTTSWNKGVYIVSIENYKQLSKKLIVQ